MMLYTETIFFHILSSKILISSKIIVFSSNVSDAN